MHRIFGGNKPFPTDEISSHVKLIQDMAGMDKKQMTSSSAMMLTAAENKVELLIEKERKATVKREQRGTWVPFIANMLVGCVSLVISISFIPYVIDETGYIFPVAQQPYLALLVAALLYFILNLMSLLGRACSMAWDSVYIRRASDRYPKNLFLIYYKDISSDGKLLIEISTTTSEDRLNNLCMWVGLRSKKKLNGLKKKLNRLSRFMVYVGSTKISTKLENFALFICSIIGLAFESRIKFYNRRLNYPKESLTYVVFKNPHRTLLGMLNTSVEYLNTSMLQSNNSAIVRPMRAIHLTARERFRLATIKTESHDEVDQASFILSDKTKIVNLCFTYIQGTKQINFTQTYAGSDLFAIIKNIFSELEVIFSSCAMDSIYARIELSCLQDEELFYKLNGEMDSDNMKMISHDNFNGYYVIALEDIFDKINLLLFSRNKPMVVQLEPFQDNETKDAARMFPPLSLGDDVAFKAYMDRVGVSLNGSYETVIPVVGLYRIERATPRVLHQWGLELRRLSKRLQTCGLLKSDDEYRFLQKFGDKLNEECQLLGNWALHGRKTIERVMDDTAASLGPDSVASRDAIMDRVTLYWNDTRIEYP
jgi:hypothetical protein